MTTQAISYDGNWLTRSKCMIVACTYPNNRFNGSTTKQVYIDMCDLVYPDKKRSKNAIKHRTFKYIDGWAKNTGIFKNFSHHIEFEKVFEAIILDLLSGHIPFGNVVTVYGAEQHFMPLVHDLFTRMRIKSKSLIVSLARIESVVPIHHIYVKRIGLK